MTRANTVLSPGCALQEEAGQGLAPRAPATREGRLLSARPGAVNMGPAGCWGGGTRGESDTPGHLVLSLPGDLVSWWELGQVHDVLGGREVGELVRSVCESRARPGT